MLDTETKGAVMLDTLPAAIAGGHDKEETNG